MPYKSFAGNRYKDVYLKIIMKYIMVQFIKDKIKHSY